MTPLKRPPDLRPAFHATGYAAALLTGLALGLLIAAYRGPWGWVPVAGNAAMLAIQGALFAVLRSRR